MTLSQEDGKLYYKLWMPLLDFVNRTYGTNKKLKNMAEAKNLDPAEVKEVADGLYDQLQKAGVEVIYDDRNVRPGEMFADADLLGVPIRVVVSPRNLKNGCIEISTRDKSVKEMIALEDAFAYVTDLKAKLFAEINEKVEEYK